MSTAAITLQKDPKTSKNLCCEFLTFNEPYVYTVSSGAGNVEVTNTQVNPIYGRGSQKIRFISTGLAHFNVGGSATQSVAQDGQYFISWDVKKDDESADITYNVEIYVNAVLVDTIVCNAYSTSGFTDGVINTYFQILNLLADDEVEISWSAQSDTVNSILIVDGFKLELNDKALQNPSFYTPPLYQMVKWETRTDNTNTQTITASIPTDYAFTGTSVKNVVNTILTVVGYSVPSRINAVITRDYCFTAVVPTGGSKWIKVEFTVNGVAIRSTIHVFVNTAGADEIVSGSWTIPVDSVFLANEGVIILTTNADTVIKNRISSHVEISNP